jgi:hypothetical protein
MTTALISKTSKLTASCIRNLRGGTDILILADKVPVASATFGGQWNGAQAIKEFRKAPKRFKPEGDLNLMSLVQQLGL